MVCGYVAFNACVRVRSQGIKFSNYMEFWFVKIFDLFPSWSDNFCNFWFYTVTVGGGVVANEIFKELTILALSNRR